MIDIDIDDNGFIKIEGLFVDDSTGEIYFSSEERDKQQTIHLLQALWSVRAPLAMWDGRSVSDIISGAIRYVSSKGGI